MAKHSLNLDESEAVEVVIIGKGKNYHHEVRTGPKKMGGYYHRQIINGMGEAVEDPADKTLYKIDPRKMFKVYGDFLSRRRDKRLGVLGRHMIVFTEGSPNAKDLNEKTMIDYKDPILGTPIKREVTAESLRTIRQTNVASKYFEAFSTIFSGRKALFIAIIAVVGVFAVIMLVPQIRSYLRLPF